MRNRLSMSAHLGSSAAYDAPGGATRSATYQSLDVVRRVMRAPALIDPTRGAMPIVDVHDAMRADRRIDGCDDRRDMVRAHAGRELCHRCGGLRRSLGEAL